MTNFLPRTLSNFCMATLERFGLHLSAPRIQDLATNATQAALVYVQENPRTSAFVVMKLGLGSVFGTTWITAGLLKIIGFGPLGPIAGTLASWYQSSYLGAYVPVGSLFSAFQKWAMTI